jgi:lysophospholipase L1-like esterase
LVSLVVLAIPLSSCVVRLVDRNSPEVNGAVTGAPANCKAMAGQITPHATQDGPTGVKLTGRFLTPQADPDDPTAPVSPDTEFDWSGNSISFRFEGTTSVTVKLKLTGQVPQDQLFEFVVDKNPPTTRQITVKKDAKGALTNEPEPNYVISNLSTGPHEVTVWKNTEAQKGSVLFQGVDLGPGHFLPSTKRARKIEVIGDSIICGYGNEGQNATCPFEVEVRKTVNVQGKLIDVTVPLTENQYMSFTSQAARMLDADVTTICWSGKGVYLNYKEAYRVDPTGALVPDVDAAKTIPDLWGTRTLAGDPNAREWDFTKEKPEDKPQVVFISLGTNDFSRDEEPTHPEDPSKLPGDNVPDGNMNRADEYAKFQVKYLEFVQNVRKFRPDAHIFLGTPPMLTDQFPLENARTRLRAVLDYIVAEMGKTGDKKVYAMNLVEMGFRYGLGCDYHPNLEVHQIMANQLAGAIRTKTCW